jgi:hypothetical protein
LLPACCTAIAPRGNVRKTWPFGDDPGFRAGMHEARK